MPSEPEVTKLPFVTLKIAQSLDGRIATATGSSQWITGPEARSFAHKLRSEHNAILVGIGTVLADDPLLTVRYTPGRDPLRVIVDSRLRIPLEAKVLAEGAAGHTLIVTTTSADAALESEIQKLGAEVWRCPVQKDDSGIDLLSVLEELSKRRIKSVLVEGGRLLFVAGQIAWDAEQRIVSREFSEQFARALGHLLLDLRPGEPARHADVHLGDGRALVLAQEHGQSGANGCVHGRNLTPCERHASREQA